MAKNGEAREVRADGNTLVAGVRGDQLVYFTADAPDQPKYADVVVVGEQRLSVHLGVLHVMHDVPGQQTVYQNVRVRGAFDGGRIVEGDSVNVPNRPVNAQVMPNGINIADKLRVIQQGVLVAFARNGGKIAIDHRVPGGQILVGQAAEDLLRVAEEAPRRGVEVIMEQARAQIEKSRESQSRSFYSLPRAIDLKIADDKLVEAEEALDQQEYDKAATLARESLMRAEDAEPDQEPDYKPSTFDEREAIKEGERRWSSLVAQSNRRSGRRSR